MSATAALKALGGKAPSGTTAAYPDYTVNGYDYPVKGTGDANDPTDTHAVWWMICITNGQVTSTQRGNINNLNQCPDNGPG
ncbi:MAG: hypothetical protein ACLP22_12370 [Solirubrobacteraceae bacterium]